MSQGLSHALPASCSSRVADTAALPPPDSTSYGCDTLPPSRPVLGAPISAISVISGRDVHAAGRRYRGAPSFGMAFTTHHWTTITPLGVLETADGRPPEGATASFV